MTADTTGTATDPTSVLLGRLHAAGLTDVVAVEHAAGGQAAVAGRPAVLFERYASGG